jgi:hypothetical protein
MQIADENETSTLTLPIRHFQRHTLIASMLFQQGGDAYDFSRTLTEELKADTYSVSKTHVNYLDGCIKVFV